MPGDVIRFGLIGGGRVARDFAVGLASVPEARLEALWSRSPATVGGFVQQFPGTRVADSAEALVSDPAVDVVYVATPHHRHAADTLLALRHDKPVLCEKPFAMSADEARPVVEEARQRGLFCMEAMWMRFIPAVQQAKLLVADGTIGEPRLLMANFGVATAYDPTNRFFDPAQGGGALLDRGVYAVSLAHMMFGAPEAVVGLPGMTTSGVDEHTGAVLRFAGGKLAVLSASLTSTTSNTASIAGTKGRVDIAAPFFCSERVSITAYDAHKVGTNDAGEDGAAAGLRERVLAGAKKSRAGRRALQLAKPLLRRPTHINRPLQGNGYEYEAAEVVRCLQAGKTESDVMSLDATLAVLEALDTLMPHR